MESLDSLKPSWPEIHEIAFNEWFKVIDAIQKADFFEDMDEDSVHNYVFFDYNIRFKKFKNEMEKKGLNFGEVKKRAREYRKNLATEILTNEIFWEKILGPYQDPQEKHKVEIEKVLSSL